MIIDISVNKSFVLDINITKNHLSKEKKQLNLKLSEVL